MSSDEDLRNLTDVELVRLCARDLGNWAAWDEFIERFNKRITIYVLRAFNARGPQPLQLEDNEQWETIRDLVQQVYTRLVEQDAQALKQFRGEYEGSIYAYLARIVTTVVLDHLRREATDRRSGETISLDQLLLDQEKPPEGIQPWLTTKESDDPLYQFREASAIEDIALLLDHLLEGEGRRRDIMVFVLHVFHGLTAQQIAGHPWFGLTQAGVESALRRVRQALREYMRPEEKGPASRSE